MKKLVLTIAILALTGLSQPAFAQVAEDHSKMEQHSQHGPSTVEDEVKQITNKDDAFKVMRDGISFMDEAVTKHKADLFADGKVMDQLHDVTVHIEEAAKFLENDAGIDDPAKKARLSSAIKQLVKTTTDFHIATHDKNVEKALIELKKKPRRIEAYRSGFKITHSQKETNHEDVFSSINDGFGYFRSCHGYG